MIYIDDVRESFDAFFRKRSVEIVRQLTSRGLVVNLDAVAASISTYTLLQTAVAATAFARMYVAADTGQLYCGVLSTGIASVRDVDALAQMR